MTLAEISEKCLVFFLLSNLYYQKLFLWKNSRKLETILKSKINASCVTAKTSAVENEEITTVCLMLSNIV